MDFILKVLLAYLLGSVVGSLVVGRLRGGVDIRKMGSGNAGSTNALRTQGVAFGVWVILIDVAKGVVAAVLIPRLALPGVAVSAGPAAQWLPAACAFASIVGHVFPVLLAPLLASWLAVVMVSGFVGLASIAASMALPVYLLIRDGAQLTPLLGFALACAALVVYTHRGNVRRMRAGTEPRARKLWLFGRGRT
jgi:glycerol-3-phosphate acyltransferase PlsY